jgi:hypothetical protein
MEEIKHVIRGNRIISPLSTVLSAVFRDSASSSNRWAIEMYEPFSLILKYGKLWLSLNTVAVWNLN